jgi:hypothetical protein
MIGLIRPIRRIGLIILFSWDSVLPLQNYNKKLPEKQEAR